MNQRINFLLALLLISTVPVLAQSIGESDNTADKRFYIKAYGGYGAFTPGSYRVETRTTYPYNVGSGTRDTTISSLGKKGMGEGVRFGGGVGYIINNFLNVGVDVEYLKGNTLKSTKSYVQSNSQYRNFGNSTLQYHVMTVNPHVLFKAKSASNYYIYNKLGVLLSLPFNLDYRSYDSTTTSQTTTTNSPVPPANPTSQTTSIYNYKSIRNVTGQYKVPLSFGLNVALGAQFKIAGNLRGFVEAFANYTVLTPTDYKEVYTTISNSSTNTVVRSLPGNNITSNATRITISTTNVTYNYAYQKEGGISYVYTPGTTSAPSPVTTGTTTTTTIVSNYSYTQTLPSINRNMNALGFNIGFAYRF